MQIVVAATRDGLGIGKDGKMPWNLPGDMSYFKALTTQTRATSKQNAVIMGRKTWDSLPAKYRPLAGRINVVLSRSVDGISDIGGVSNSSTDGFPNGPDVHVCNSLQTASELLASPEMRERVETVFVIGGGQVYREALASPLCEAVHLTQIDGHFAGARCDTYFPTLDPDTYRLWSASESHEDDGVRYSFLCYTRACARAASVAASDAASDAASVASDAAHGSQLSSDPATQLSSDPGTQEIQLPPAIASRHEETQYLELINQIINTGVFRPDRTGTGTYSRFGASMRFNLRHTFPLLTTKRVFWRGVVEELLWFVAGSTDAHLLRDRGIHIWDGNSSREYLDSIGLNHREEGDLGPVYGFQWRHFGAQYVDRVTDYTGQGVDQLSDLIHRITTNPTDRRLVLTAWNPAALRDMALPPCHMFCQFYVAHGELSCLMYQRSCDMGLGVPFNIASYSLLTCMVAQVCGLRPGELIHMMGDTHVYANHVDPLKEQLKNAPRHFPTLKINPAKTDIDSFAASDFELVGYTPHKKIEMKMAV